MTKVRGAVAPWRKLRMILSIAAYRRIALGVTALYLALFLIVLQNISLGGQGFQFLTVEWTRMFHRTGAITFEPIAMIILPGLTILLSPLNIAIGLGLALLAAVNLVMSFIAFEQPKACTFNRSGGILASVPALLAGSACCAPALVLILSLQVSSLFVAVFQVLIPASFILLLITLKLILDRTDVDLIQA